MLKRTKPAKVAHIGARKKEGRRMAPLSATLLVALGRRADRLARRRRGRRGGGVLELLLRAKERVEHLLAKVLGEGEREHRSHEQEQQQPAAPALPLLLRPAERVGRITQR